MAPAPRYQALPVLREDIRRRSVAVSAVSSEHSNILPGTVSVVSSEHERNIWSQNVKYPENRAFLSRSHSNSKKDYNNDNFLLNEEDITSGLSYDEGRTLKDPPTSSLEGNTHQFDGKILNWLPYTLRIPFLFILFALSLALALVVILLSWVSSTRDGLGADNKTSILLFGWRFTPTLIVVLFVILETLLLNDARRTEVYARLSNPSASANASSTVLSVRGHLWTDIFDAMSSKRNGGLRSQVLLYAAIMNIVGSFILSPLSAAFLSVEPTQISRNAVFTSLPSIRNATTAVSPDDETYFRTISALVVNLTTSAWLTDNYAIVPFWPADLSQSPLGATVPVTPQNWTANTTIFQAQLICTPMPMTDLQQTASFSFRLASDDGCSLNVAVGIPETTSGASILREEASNNNGPIENDAQEDAQFYFPILNSGSFWLSPFIDPNSFSSVLTSSDHFRNQTILTNVSTACQDRYILATNTPFNVSYHYPANWTTEIALNASDISSNLSSFSISSHICGSQFVMANLSASISISSSNTTITFDEAAFNRSKVELLPSNFNVTSFESAFYSNTWTKKLNTSYYGTWMGPSAALGALYGYDAQAMIDDPLLLSKAQQVEQRFFGEGLMTAFSKVAAQGSTVIGGEITASKQRVVASFGIGMTMGILFLCTCMMVVLVFHFSRLSRRPLNLDRDPGSAAAVSSLLKDTQTRSHFQGLERLPVAVIERRLEDLHFELQSQGLTTHHAPTVVQAQYLPQPTYSKDWRPFVLRGTGGLSLISAIFLLIIGLSVLFAMSEARGIYQAGFVYQLNISFNDGYITSLAPYSIIPTLIAVGARFWWIALEETFKRLQPYVNMTKRPVPMSAGPALSYQSLSPIWSVFKAVRMKHWLLALICTGTVLMEAFTVGMSALFQRNESSLTSHISLSRDFRLREVPEIFFVDEPSDPDAGDTATPEILQGLYGDSQVFLSWIYGAVIELSYAGSNLAWTQAEWSFVPANLNSTTFGPGISPANEAANITLDTSALRGRLECTAVDMSNTSNWLTTWDLTNSSAWNMSAVMAKERQYKTGYGLGAGLEEPTFFLGSGPKNLSAGIWSTFFSNPSRVRCCANGTDGEPGLAALGYWAPVGYGANDDGAQGHGAEDFEAQEEGSDSSTLNNFTVTWVIGQPFPDEWQLNTGENDTESLNGHYLWSKIPQVVSLNCAPIIEASNTTITVTREDEQVIDFSLLETPSVHKPAWSDYYLHHNNSGENGDNIQYQVKDNITVSYGYLFLDALLGAADSARVASTNRWGYYDEPINDRIFVFRQTGYNSDLMSFATYSILDGNHSALLDSTLLAETSSTVFGKFFQHFVSENGSSGGGRAYMPLNYTLPGDFLPIVSTSHGANTSYQDANASTVISPTVSAVLSRPVYKLEMSKVAVILCLAVLVFLGFTTSLIAVGSRHYFKALPRDMNTLASIIALVYDSPKLLKWVAQHGVENQKAHVGEVKAVLGHFQGSGGEMRWGIELIEEEDIKKPYDKHNSSGPTSEYELLEVRSERPPEMDSRRMLDLI